MTTAKIRITASDETKAGLRSVEQGFAKLKSEAKGIGSALQSFSAGLGGLTGQLAGVAAIGAGLTAIRSTVDGLAQLDDAAEQTGASVEALSALLNTLRPSGASLEQITDIAGKLTKSMVGAGEEASKAAEAFRAIGVSTKDAQGNLRSVDDVLVDVAQALNTYADGSNKVALAQALLGKSGAQYLPILKDLATTERQAASVTAEQAAAAESLQKAWGRLAVEGERLKVSIFGPLITGLSELIDRFSAAQRTGANFFNSLGVAIRGTNPNARSELAEVERNLQKSQELKANLDRLGVVGSLLAGPAKLLAGANAAGLEQQRQKLKAQVAELDAAEASFRAAERGYGTGSRQAPAISGGGSGGAAARAAKEQLRAVEDYAQRIQSEVAQAIQGSDVIKAQEYADKIAELDRLFFDAGLSADVYQSAMEKIAGIQPPKDLSAELERQAEAIRDSVDPLARFRKELELIGTLEVNGFLSGDVANLKRFLIGNEIDGVITGVKELGEATKETGNWARDMGLTFTSAFEDAVVGGESLRDVIEGIGKDLLRIGTRTLVTEPLGEWFEGVLGGAKGGESLVSGAGNWLSSLFGGARAAGGPVSSNRMYMVGEQGPEMFVPNVPGTIVPNDALATGGGVVVNMTVNASDAESFRRSEGQIAARLSAIASRGARFA